MQIEKRENFSSKLAILWLVPKGWFLAFDKKVEGALSFFLKNWGKSKFMVAMSKRIQSKGLESVLFKSPKAFFYFFMFYLIRDTILYIIIPIWFASATN